MVTFSFAQVKDQLSPAEKNLNDADAMMKPMTSQLRALKDLLENARQKAQEARDSSEDAEREAANGSNVRGSRFLPVNGIWIMNYSQLLTLIQICSDTGV